MSQSGIVCLVSARGSNCWDQIAKGMGYISICAYLYFLIRYSKTLKHPGLRKWLLSNCKKAIIDLSTEASSVCVSFPISNTRDEGTNKLLSKAWNLLSTRLSCSSPTEYPNNFRIKLISLSSVSYPFYSSVWLANLECFMQCNYHLCQGTPHWNCHQILSSLDTNGA